MPGAARIGCERYRGELVSQPAIRRNIATQRRAGTVAQRAAAATAGKLIANGAPPIGDGRCRRVSAPPFSRPWIGACQQTP